MITPCPICGLSVAHPVYLGDNLGTCKGPPDSMAKIRLKSTPKQYKRGPGLTGRARLERRLNNLALAANRLARKAPASTDGQWAALLAESLRALVTREAR